MITGTDLLQISLARENVDRAALETAGVIERGQVGDKAWSNFGRDMDTFILKLPEERRAALALIIQQASLMNETPH